MILGIKLYRTAVLVAAGIRANRQDRPVPHRNSPDSVW